MTMLSDNFSPDYYLVSLNILVQEYKEYKLECIKLCVLIVLSKTAGYI